MGAESAATASLGAGEIGTALQGIAAIAGVLDKGNKATTQTSDPYIKIQPPRTFDEIFGGLGILNNLGQTINTGVAGVPQSNVRNPFANLDLASLAKMISDRFNTKPIVATASQIANAGERTLYGPGGLSEALINTANAKREDQARRHGGTVDVNGQTVYVSDGTPVPQDQLPDTNFRMTSQSQVAPQPSFEDILTQMLQGAV